MLFTHTHLVAETGGRHGMRDLGVVEAAFAKQPNPEGNPHGASRHRQLTLPPAGIFPEEHRDDVGG